MVLQFLPELRNEYQEKEIGHGPVPCCRCNYCDYCNNFFNAAPSSTMYYSRLWKFNTSTNDHNPSDTMSRSNSNYCNPAGR